jgi:hypothetical protein
MTWRRLPFLVPAGLALLLGVDAGLALLGVPVAPVPERQPEVHGPLLVLGFVGTLVALERAVALRRRPGFAAPLLLGAGALLLVAPVSPRVGQAVLTAGTAALVAVYVSLWRRQRDDAVLVQAVGAVLATGAAVLWLGGVPVPRVLPWLAGFVVLTIAGERLELARLEMLGSGGAAALLGASTAVAVSVVGSLLWPAAGFTLLGLSLLALVAWLAAHDVARRTVRASGLPRFIAVCLLAGYAWLAVAGALWLGAGAVLDGPAYDAVVHAVFLGFTLSMIMAHAPVILPAVLRVRLPYRPAMYAPVLLLHTSLVVRTLLGDARGLQTATEVGGLLNAVAVLLFLGTLVWSAVRPAPRRARAAGPASSSTAPQAVSVGVVR